MKYKTKTTRLKKGDKICVHLKVGTIGLWRTDEALRFTGGNDKKFIKTDASVIPINRNDAFSLVALIAAIANLRVGEIWTDTETLLVVKLA